MVDPKATDNEDPNLGAPMEPQTNTENPELDTPVNDAGLADAAAAPAPEDSDHQEDANPDASKLPGEAKGKKTKEQVAAEKAPAAAKETNPVAEATEIESKDPYAEGKHIANPEPNNGAREDGEEAPLPSANPDALSDEELAEKTATSVQDQKHVEANTKAA